MSEPWLWSFLIMWAATNVALSFIGIGIWTRRVR